MNPSKQQLLDSIQPGMRLTKGFFKKIYGYEITDPSFPDKAIAALEVAGCGKARQYYKEWIEEYEMARDAELKSALGRCLRGDEERRKIELLQKKKQLLMQKLQR
ncbi:MAG: hypothetical protein HDR06_11450 [Lachnospiraceae bacterium]|nr:hypothetical protein [Lachnospiraceae bacterium]